MNDNFYYFRKNTSSQMFDRVVVCTPPPLSAVCGRGWTSKQIFKRAAWQYLKFWREVAKKEGVTFFGGGGGGGVAIFT